jgi:hypothetical protein
MLANLTNTMSIKELDLTVGITRVNKRPRRDPSDHIPFGLQTGIDRRANSLAIWLALIGLVLPSPEMQFHIAGARFTPGRLCVLLLFFPALVALFQRGRHFLLSDIFAVATGAWMIGAVLSTRDLDSLSSASAVCIEFLGGYVVARGLIFGPAALDTFVRVLKLLTVVMIILAMADRLAGRWVAQETIATIFHTSSPGALLRNGAVRATSTLDHPIIFGAFCGLVTAIVLYCERSAFRRVLYCGLCLIGCYLAQSSAGLMSFLLILAIYVYDSMLKQFSWRWRALWIFVAVLAIALFLVSDHPFASLIYHFTLDRETGYYRLMIWEAATPLIWKSPLVGYGFQSLSDDDILHSIDSVWLVHALRFGLPMIAFLSLANIASLWPARRTLKGRTDNSLIDTSYPAFSMILVMFLLTGFTVHYWNYIWIFWSLCIGIRASLRERSIQLAGR